MSFDRKIGIANCFFFDVADVIYCGVGGAFLAPSNELGELGVIALDLNMDGSIWRVASKTVHAQGCCYLTSGVAEEDALDFASYGDYVAFHMYIP